MRGKPGAVHAGTRGRNYSTQVGAPPPADVLTLTAIWGSDASSSSITREFCHRGLVGGAVMDPMPAIGDRISATIGSLSNIEMSGGMVVRGEGTTVAQGVTPDEAFDFVLDPAQYVKADTKMLWVTKLADLPNGMIAREDGKFLGKFKGSVITRYTWQRPTSIDVVIEHGVPRGLHAWFEIKQVDGGTQIRHVEELDLGHGPLGWVHDRLAGAWFARSVRAEVDEIGRFLEAGERGQRVHAL